MYYNERFERVLLITLDVRMNVYERVNGSTWVYVSMYDQYAAEDCNFVLITGPNMVSCLEMFSLFYNKNRILKTDSYH